MNVRVSGEMGGSFLLPASDKVFVGNKLIPLSELKPGIMATRADGSLVARDRGCWERSQRVMAARNEGRLPLAPSEGTKNSLMGAEELCANVPLCENVRAVAKGNVKIATVPVGGTVRVIVSVEMPSRTPKSRDLVRKGVLTEILSCEGSFYDDKTQEAVCSHEHWRAILANIRALCADIGVTVIL